MSPSFEPFNRHSFHEEPLRDSKDISRATSPGASSVAALGSPDHHLSRSPSPRQAAPSDLPALPKFPGTWDSISSPPERPRKEKGAFYTATWGSPYAPPSPKRSVRNLGQRSSQVPDPEDLSTSLRAGYEDQPSGIPKRIAHDPIALSVVGKRKETQGRSIKDFTEDWIDQYLSGQQRTERSNWLSDEDSGSEASDIFIDRPHLVEEPTDDGWLGFDNNELEQDLLKTPTLRNFLARKGYSEKGYNKSDPQFSKHVSTPSTSTLKQEDFWGFAYGDEANPITMNDHQVATDPDPTPPVSPVDKPLPPPPAVETQSSQSTGMSFALSESTLSEPASPKIVKRPTLTSNSSSQSNKKRVLVGNRAWVILLPTKDERGSEKSNRLLTPSDVSERMNRWAERGYNIQGFDIWAPEPSLLPGENGSLSRLPYPDPVESTRQWQAKEFPVRLPNLEDWESYVRSLQEEKLRALGVFKAEDEPDDIIPPSIQDSIGTYSGLLASSPLPTSSAASNPLAMAQPFSPHFNSAGPINSIGSLASPAPQPGMQLPFFGIDPSIPPNLHSFQPTPPIIGSITPQSMYKARQAGISPTGSGMPNLNSILSPISPINPEEMYNLQPGFSDNYSSRRQSLRQNNRHSQELEGKNGLSRSATLISEQQITPEFSPMSNTEIVQPTPLGHSHNLSETLQKGLDRYTLADYHLEDSIQRQLEDDDQSPVPDATPLGWAAIEDSFQTPEIPPNFNHQTSFSNGHHRLFGEQPIEDVDHDGADIDTNPSLAGSPHVQEEEIMHNPWHSAKPSIKPFSAGHKPKSSFSRLNVEAKEFDPTGSFSSNSFTFTGNTFRPTEMSTAKARFSPSTSTINTGRPINNFNAAAPAFTPFGSQGSSFSRTFTFNAGFNVEAPSFNPGQSFHSYSGSEVPVAPENTIFGGINLAEISKLTKKSKAVPIICPDDNLDDENKEDQDHSRPGTPQSAIKRVRRGANDSEKDIEFAPLSLPLSEVARTQSAAISSHGYKVAEGKENALPADNIPQDGADSKVSEISKEPQILNENVADVALEDSETPSLLESANNEAHFSSEPPKESEISVTPSDTTEKIITVHDTTLSQGIEDQIDVTVTENMEDVQAHGRSSSPKFIPPQESPSEEAEAKSVRAETAITQSASIEDTVLPVAPIQHQPEPPESEPKNSGLSNTAKPFTFRPSTAEFLPPNLPAVNSNPVERPSKPKPSGLMASRYADSLSSDSQELENLRFQSGHPAAKVIEQDLLPQVQESVRYDSDHSKQTADSVNEDELNAVMEKLNGDESDVGVERAPTPNLKREFQDSFDLQSAPQHSQPLTHRNAPSPSPQRTYELAVTQDVPRLGSDYDRQSRRGLSPIGRISHSHSPIRQMISRDEHISDWDDLIVSGEEEKLFQRTRFFDTPVHDMVSTVIDSRLGPLEDSIGNIQQYITSLNTRSTSRRPRHGSAAGIEHSDADDEDDEIESFRPLSPASKRDQKLEKMKSAFLEALSIHESAKELPEIIPATDLKLIHDDLAELKALAATLNQLQQSENIKDHIQETLSNHLTRLQSDASEIGVDTLKLQTDGLKTMLRVADERAEKEYRGKREVQDALDEVQQLLKIAEEDAGRHRQAAEQAEGKLRELHEEKIPHFEKVQARSDALSKQQESLELTLSELSAKNIALEETLDEYRLSHDQWKRENAELQLENKDLLSDKEHLKSRIEDSMRARQSLRGKFDRLQDDMASAARDIAQERAVARKKEEELTAKFDALKAAYDRETKLREKLEMDIGELEQQEREAARLKFVFDQSQQENVRLEQLVATLRQESYGYQNKAARFEREFNDARESSHIEIQRVRTSMEADVEAANNQVNYVRAELEAQIVRAESQLEHARLDAGTMKDRYELLLEEARESKAAAVAEITASKENALEEQRRSHERALNDLRERHARILHNNSEDRQRAESVMTEKLSLAIEKVNHLQDRVTHLEEKLEIAKSAARAAAQAAQAKSAPVSHHSASPSIPYRKNSLEPERISPQALRESILVLQDQLQQRESCIEELEQELSAVDKDAPNKIKEQETEINWLRELLSVRVDELQDIIHTLSQPSFDQNVVRDAAIRLRTNLQMEQQEKERSANGVKTFPSLSDLSNLAASPRSLPLAAAAAWGNWRKGRESFTSEATGRGYQQTPSKTATANGFLSGLLTPPSSDVRTIPQNASAPPGIGKLAPRHTFSESRPLRAYSQPLRSLSTRQAGKPPQQLEPPTTPPLLRNSSYDHDAEPSSYDSSTLMEDGDSVIGESLVLESPQEIGEAFFNSQPS